MPVRSSSSTLRTEEAPFPSGLDPGGFLVYADVPATQTRAVVTEDAAHILTEVLEELRALREDLSEGPPGVDSSVQLLTRQEAADRLRISKRKLDDLAAADEISQVRLGGRVLYRREWIDALIRRNTT